MNSSSKNTISGFIICSNEAHQIARAIASIRFCDELIVVVDDKSKDKTAEIAQSMGARVLINPWPGFVRQKAFGLAQCSGEWVLNIDADEELSPELQAEIKDLCSRDEGMAGYEINRVVYFLNRWWRRGGWYPEFRLRLLRRSLASWGGDDPHEHAIVSGPVRRLAGELFHYTHDDIADQINTLNKFSSQAARTLDEKSRTMSLTKLIARPLARFLKFYLLKQGYKDGVAGLIVAVNESVYVFLKYAKLWERQSLKKPQIK